METGTTFEIRDEAPPTPQQDHTNIENPNRLPGSPEAAPKRKPQREKHNERTAPVSPATRHIQDEDLSPHRRHASLGCTKSQLQGIPNLTSRGLVPTSPPRSLQSSFSSPAMRNPNSPVHALGRHSLGMMPATLSPFGTSPHPPSISKIQKAMEAAIVTERKRTKEMEAKEGSLNADELRIILKDERHRMCQLAADLARHKTRTVHGQLEAEMMEEGRINGLMRRLEELQCEKGHIINELEREEEMLTNTLQKKLDQVKREKNKLEQLLRAEQASHSPDSSTSKIPWMPGTAKD